MTNSEKDGTDNWISKLVIIDHEPDQCWYMRGTEEELDEIKRLARLGFWAERYPEIWGKE